LHLSLSSRHFIELLLLEVISRQIFRYSLQKLPLFFWVFIFITNTDTAKITDRVQSTFSLQSQLALKLIVFRLELDSSWCEFLSKIICYQTWPKKSHTHKKSSNHNSNWSVWFFGKSKRIQSFNFFEVIEVLFNWFLKAQPFETKIIDLNLNCFKRNRFKFISNRGLILTWCELRKKSFGFGLGRGFIT